MGSLTADGSLFESFDGQFQRGPVGDLELSGDNDCDRVSVPECLACDGNLLTDFHTT